jgi:hypothetical protein
MCTFTNCSYKGDSAMRFSRPALVAGALAAAFGVAGCGSSSTAVTQTGAAASVAPQGRTVTQVVKTVTRSAQTKRPRKAPATATAQPVSRNSNSSAGGGKVVPGGLVGHVLNDAEHRLDGQGISYSHQGGFVIINGDWGVCSTTPAAGQPVRGAVVLHVGHFKCGAGSAPASGGSAAGRVVPGDLVGHVLNDVEDRLDSQGVKYSEQGGFVILRGDWGVCSTTPAAGQPVHGAVVLHVGHFSCGAE